MHRSIAQYTNTMASEPEKEMALLKGAWGLAMMTNIIKYVYTPLSLPHFFLNLLPSTLVVDTYTYEDDLGNAKCLDIL